MKIYSIYNIDKSKSYNLKNHRYKDDYHYDKRQFINNSIVNNITKKNIINNNENVLKPKKDYSYKTYITNNYKSQIAYVEIIYIRNKIVEHSITQVTYTSILTNIQLMCLITIR